MTSLRPLLTFPETPDNLPETLGDLHEAHSYLPEAHSYLSEPPGDLPAVHFDLFPIPHDLLQAPSVTEGPHLTFLWTQLTPPAATCELHVDLFKATTIL